MKQEKKRTAISQGDDNHRHQGPVCFLFFSLMTSNYDLVISNQSRYLISNVTKKKSVKGIQSMAVRVLERFFLSLFTCFTR